MGGIRGGDKHLRRLRAMTGPALVRQVTKALFVGGNTIQVEAQHLITSGAVSGAGHVASRPGEPPNADTHALDRQIETFTIGPLRVNVESSAPHALIMELGGTINHPGGTPYFIGADGMAVFVSKEKGAGLPVTRPHLITIAERPYMRPAARRKRGEAVDLVRQAVNMVNAAAGRGGK